MSAKRAVLYSSTNVPTVLTTAYTATGNTHIDQATVCNDTGAGITIAVTVAGVPVYDTFNIAAGDQVSLSLLINHALNPTQTIQVNASAADLNMIISGRDF